MQSSRFAWARPYLPKASKSRLQSSRTHKRQTFEAIMKATKAQSLALLRCSPKKLQKVRTCCRIDFSSGSSGRWETLERFHIRSLQMDLLKHSPPADPRFASYTLLGVLMELLPYIVKDLMFQWSARCGDWHLSSMALAVKSLHVYVSKQLEITWPARVEMQTASKEPLTEHASE